MCVNFLLFLNHQSPRLKKRENQKTLTKHKQLIRKHFASTESFAWFCLSMPRKIPQRSHLKQAIISTWSQAIFFFQRKKKPEISSHHLIISILKELDDLLNVLTPSQWRKGDLYSHYFFLMCQPVTENKFNSRFSLVSQSWKAERRGGGGEKRRAGEERKKWKGEKNTKNKERGRRKNYPSDLFWWLTWGSNLTTALSLHQNTSLSPLKCPKFLQCALWNLRSSRAKNPYSLSLF